MSDTPLTTFTFPYIRVVQPIGEFFVGVMSAKNACAISFAEIRHPEDSTLAKYLGIQRFTSEKRINEIRQYLSDPDCTFPTSVILAVMASDVTVKETGNDYGLMVLPTHGSVASIIDGQHRLEGLRGYSGERFDLVVAVFLDMEIEDQAHVFATINLAQTRVNKSLAYDLLEHSRFRFPKRVCHQIARLLNSTKGSPLFQRIKILGTATPGVETETITQAAFIDALVGYLSKDPAGDKIKAARGEKLDRVESSSDARFLRNWYLDDNDADIAALLWEYFAAIQRRWPIAWSDVETKGNILPRRAGFDGFMKFFPVAVGQLPRFDKQLVRTRFDAIFKSVILEAADFNPQKFKPGGTGPKDLAIALEEQSRTARG